MMNHKELQNLLDESYDRYNTLSFIKDDPISIPHLFSRKEDIEIAGFFAATIAWGQRPQIIRCAMKLMKMMDNQPHQFILNATEEEINEFAGFVYRTFNGQDCICFIKALQNIYQNHNGLESIFTKSYQKHSDIKEAIVDFRRIFFEIPHPKRSEKHVSDAAKLSACKRINLFLRWMIRNDNRGVDFGLWKNIPASALYIPLDVHTGNTSRALGLLNEKQNNWKAVAQLTEKLKQFDAADPVKYDFALFGLGVYDGL